MPIRREKRAAYRTRAWLDIAAAIKDGRAQWRCECTGECAGPHGRARCSARHLEPIGEGLDRATLQLAFALDGRADDDAKERRVILTVAHLDHSEAGDGNDTPSNLRAFCQACHLRYDLAQHLASRKRRRAGATLPLALTEKER